MPGISAICHAALKRPVAGCNTDVEMPKLFNALAAIFAHLCSFDVVYLAISVPINVNFCDLFLLILTLYRTIDRQYSKRGRLLPDLFS